MVWRRFAFSLVTRWRAARHIPVAGDMNRDEELTLRLTNLIELLAEESGVVEPPIDAAASWTEAAVRAYFRSGGTVSPEQHAKPASSRDVIPGQPGGGRVLPIANEPQLPTHVERARIVATTESYRTAAFSAGIPDRAWGLFPPDDPVMKGILSEPGSYRPFTKNMVGLSGQFEAVQASWMLSEGLDMRRAAVRPDDFTISLARKLAEQATVSRRNRYFFQSAGPFGVGSKLAAAVRFGAGAAIAAGMGTGAHGGSIEARRTPAPLEKNGGRDHGYSLRALSAHSERPYGI